jgi:transposase
MVTRPKGKPENKTQSRRVRVALPKTIKRSAKNHPPVKIRERAESKVDLSPVPLRAGASTRSKAHKREAKERSTMRTVALDLGAKKIVLSEVKDQKIIHRQTVKYFRYLKDALGPNTPSARVAFEACREGWHVARELEQWGHEPVMVDTTRTKKLGVGQHGRKTDRLDADQLALCLERGLIPVAHILSKHRQELRFHLGVHRALVSARAEYVTQMREMVRARGQRVASCDTAHFALRLEKTALDESTGALISPLAQVLESLDAQIAIEDVKLEQLANQEPVIQRLMTAPGVALIVATAFVSVVDEARRFRNAHELESYLGLVPCEDSSGGRRRLGSISKAGNKYARAMLVQAGWCILRMDADKDPLVRWGQQLAARRGKRIAIVAIARRLAGILWAMWRDDTVYDPRRVGLSSARGLAVQAQDVAYRALAMERAARKARLYLSASHKRAAALPSE